jgi:hypothetical protein
MVSENMHTSLNSIMTCLVICMCSFLMCFIDMTVPLYKPISEKIWPPPVVVVHTLCILRECDDFMEPLILITWSSLKTYDLLPMDWFRLAWILVDNVKYVYIMYIVF